MGVAEDVLGKCAAGIFTQPYATQLMLEALELSAEKKYLDRSGVNEEVLRMFLTESGRRFYQTGDEQREGWNMLKQLQYGPGQDVIVPFKQGEAIYSLNRCDHLRRAAYLLLIPLPPSSPS